MRERVCVWERDTASSYKRILSATQPAMQRGTCFHFFHIAYLVKNRKDLTPFPHKNDFWAEMKNSTKSPNQEPF